MLEIRNLTKIYKPKKGVPVTALDNVSLKLPDKGMVFVLGKSGSGKSTLLNVLGGLDSYTSGEFIIKGEEAKGFKQMHYDSYRNTYIGFIFQEYNILKDFTVGANIALALELQGKPSSNEEINRILKEVDLEGYGDRKPNELSGGQLQRVAIARALVKNPDIIMADEPTGALDSKTGEAIFETLKKLSAEKLVLIVSHDRDFSERYADRIIELADGKIISDVTLDTSSKIEKKEKYEDYKNIVYEDNKINIVNGFELSDDEFLRIKEYIKNYNGPVDLNLNVRNRINKKYQFVNTNVDDIEMDNSGFKLIKSKLSLKNSFKIGASGLKYKKAKLVFTIFLSFIAFTFFGLADTVACYDLENTTINSIIDSNIDYASFVKSKRYGMNDDDYYYLNEKFTESEINELNSRTGLNLKGVYFNDKFNTLGLSYFSNVIVDKDNNLDYNSPYTTQFYGSIEFDNADLIKFGYKLLDGSTLPDGAKDEILLTKYEAQSFIGNKLIIYGDDGVKKEEVEIKSEIDLINKNLYLGNRNYEITGIIDTNMDIARFDLLKEDPSENLDLNYYTLLLELNSLKENSLHSLLFVGYGFNERKGISKIDTLANLNSGSFSITNKDDTIGNFASTYISNFTTLDLLSDDSDYYVVPLGENNITKLNKDQTILSDYAFYQVIEAGINGSDNVNDYDLTYNIEGTDYTLFNYLKFDTTKGMNYFIAKVNPVNCEYASARYAFECMKQDYSYWKEKAASAGFNSDGPEVYNVAKYIIRESKITDFDLTSGTESARKIKELNTQILIEMFNKYCEVNINMIYHNYSYYDDEEITKLYNVNIVGVAYINSVYNNLYAVLTDDIWNEYFDYNPYEIYKFAVGELQTNRELVKKLVKITMDESQAVKYELSNNVIDEVFGLKDILDVLGQVFFWIGLVFAIFASLLLSNFIATSISYKKEEIGILRAIGSRSNDVFRIFFSEAFIIAMINFVLSSLATFLIALFINNLMRSETYLQVTIISFGIRQIGLLLVLCVAVAFIASFLPVNKNAKKKPIDAIRNR